MPVAVAVGGCWVRQPGLRGQAVAAGPQHVPADGPGGGERERTRPEHGDQAHQYQTAARAGQHSRLRATHRPTPAGARAEHQPDHRPRRHPRVQQAADAQPEQRRARIGQRGSGDAQAQR